MIGYTSQEVSCGLPAFRPYLTLNERRVLVAAVGMQVLISYFLPMKHLANEKMKLHV